MRIRQRDAQEFYDRWSRQAVLDESTRAQGAILHRSLMTSTFDIVQSAVPVRQPSISLDGTPVIYSLQLPVSAEHPAFRVLCEPGGVGITVPQQIDHSLVTVQEMLTGLDWPEAAGEINAVVSAIFPPDPAALSSWWGGIWLGASIGTDSAELRIYLNLRHGDAASRWQRTADALRPFATRDLEEPLRELIARTAPVAIPVGLGLVVRNGRVAALRLYAGMHRPGIETILRARPLDFTTADAGLTDLCRAFEAAYGPFRSQSVTLGYDFVRTDEGTLLPRIARFKADLSCEGLGPDADPTPAAFLTQQLQRLWPGQETHWERFRADLGQVFGGSSMRYISLGARSGLSHLTAYLVPGAPADE